MKLVFPSLEFDDAVAAVCNGCASDEQTCGLNDLLRTNPAARDKYILLLEIHSRLASEPDLFIGAKQDEAIRDRCEFIQLEKILPLRLPRRVWNQKLTWAVALAACITVLAVGLSGLRNRHFAEPKGTTSKAVAMLNRAVDAQWSQPNEVPILGAPLEPGWLRLKSGLVQIVLYSGVRVAIEGPAEVELISQSEVSCRTGRLIAEVPPQARGFRIRTAQMSVKDLGTSFGLDVQNRRSELHVFKGSVELQPAANATRQTLQEGAGAVAEGARPIRLISANPVMFASLFDLQTKSLAAEAECYDQWRVASSRLNRDPSLLVHFDFENASPSDWRLHNAANQNADMPEATIVGCQWLNGRWPNKQALGFQSVSDRVRLNVPGEFSALTLAAWVRVQGLDRRFNSLFMCDGFEPGELHWLIRSDGILNLTVKGHGSGNFQMFPSPPELTLNRLGLWVHLAVVLDASSKRAIHYVNGRPVNEQALELGPPFRIGAAELGNWNAGEFAGDDDTFLIRNFSGAMDEFCLFSRALSEVEMLELYSKGKPEPGF